MNRKRKRKGKIKLKITPRTDIIFRNIFGKKGNESILEDFLEGVLGEKVIVENIYKNEEIDIENVYEKKSVIDIKAELKDGRIINIEMQNSKCSYFDKRTLYYLSKLITTQIQLGEDYPKIKDVIVINILNYKIPQIPEYITKCYIKNENDYFVKGATVYFIQLPRFIEKRKVLDPNSKYEDIIKCKLDEWCIFLTDKNKGVRNMAAKKNFDLEKAIRQYEKLSSIPEVVETSFRRQLAEMDIRAEKQAARERGEKAGRKAGMKAGMKAGRKAGVKAGMKAGKAEGRIEGMLLKQKEIAKKLLEQKVSMKIIMQVTGLTKEEVEQC